MSMWFDYYGRSDYVLYKNMSTSGSTEQISAMSSIIHVSKLLPSTLWQEVTGALWPLHPDLTGMNISYAILFLLSPHPDLSQLLSDLKQEFIDSQKLRNLSSDVPFSRHVAETLPGWLGRDYHQWTCNKHNWMCTVSPEGKSDAMSKVTCVRSSLWAWASFWAKSSWFWHSDSCSFSWIHIKTTENRGSQQSASQELKWIIMSS